MLSLIFTRSAVPLFFPIANADQAAPTGLTGVAPTTFGGTDGKITGTTTAMEYKLASDSTYTTCSAVETTVAAAGTYNVRYAAKIGYNVGAIADVVVPALAIGHSYGGGVVAYILQPGESNGVYSYDPNVQHGLIAATEDQSTGIAWITGGSTQETWVNGTGYGGTSTACGTGQANTNAMMAQTGYTGGAAKVCDDYSKISGGYEYSHWFLPSQNELDKLYINRAAIGGFTSNCYWNSSESSSFTACYQNFSSGSWSNFYKSETYRVRAVRDF